MQAAQIIVKRERRGLTVVAVGRTGKGQLFVKGSRVLLVSSIADKNFKAQMLAAVAELLGTEA